MNEFPKLSMTNLQCLYKVKEEGENHFQRQIISQRFGFLIQLNIF